MEDGVIKLSKYINIVKVMHVTNIQNLLASSMHLTFCLTGCGSDLRFEQKKLQKIVLERTLYIEFRIFCLFSIDILIVILLHVVATSIFFFSFWRDNVAYIEFTIFSSYLWLLVSEGVVSIGI